VHEFKYLLDTNIVSDLVRQPQGAVARSVARVGESAVCTSIVVACELRYGAAKKGSARLSEQLDAVLSVLTTLPLETDADRHYGSIRAALERRGEPIGPNDLLIASQALALGLTLVTDNTAEFRRVPGLKLANWIERLAPVAKAGPPSVQEPTAHYATRKRAAASSKTRTRR
jgi:tRNA(fMet)-specific endonuclease VapC